MARTVAISHLKAHCLRLLDDVARRRRELVVTKRGKPIARVVPFGDAQPDETLAGLRGTLAGGGTRIEDFDTHALWNAARR
jgi:prevent-host-death family protein